jgi:hypothetical protein
MRIALLDIVMYPKKRSTLSRKAEPPRARLGRRRVWQALCILAFTCLLKDYSVAKENYKPTHYKQYILIELQDFTEAYCLIDLYTAESRLNPKARNGSHYGIPQGRSKYLATVDGTKQIDWGIKYINNRYGSMCKALHHFKIKGWH